MLFRYPQAAGQAIAVESLQQGAARAGDKPATEGTPAEEVKPGEEATARESESVCD